MATACFCFNYRSDRMRQIVRALHIEGFDGFEVAGRPRLAMVTMTQYDQTFPVPQAFPPFSMARIVAEVLADHGRTQLRTAETEKYPHVTYFFNGGYEPPYQGEERALVPSQKVATYDLAPEMSAAGITDVLCRRCRRRATTSCSATSPTPTWWATPESCRPSSRRWRRWISAWAGSSPRRRRPAPPCWSPPTTATAK